MIYKLVVNQIGHTRMIPDEAHVSTQQNQALPHPWVPEPHEHQGRPPGPEAPPGQRTEAPDRLAPAGAPLSRCPRTPNQAPDQGAPLSTGKARFRKADHLRRRREYLAAQAAGKRLYTPHFGVVLAPGPAARPRLGLVVTKRLGKAVRRNRVKRLLREFFRRHQAELPKQDIIIMAKKGAAALTYHEVQRELARILLDPTPEAHD